MQSTNQRIETLELQICDILILQDKMSDNLDQMSEDLDRLNAILEETISVLAIQKEHMLRLMHPAL